MWYHHSSVPLFPKLEVLLVWILLPASLGDKVIFKATGFTVHRLVLALVLGLSDK